MVRITFYNAGLGIQDAGKRVKLTGTDGVLQQVDETLCADGKIFPEEATFPQRKDSKL